MANRILGVFFFLVGLAAVFVGGVAFLNAPSIMQEIFGALCCVVATGCITIAALCDISTSLQTLAKISEGAADDAGSRDRARAAMSKERWENFGFFMDRLDKAVTGRNTRFDVDEEHICELDDAPASAVELPRTESPPVTPQAAPTAIRAKCSKCGKVVKGGADWAGRLGNCPACNNPIKFPSTNEVLP